MKTFFSLTKALACAQVGQVVVIVGENFYLPESAEDWREIQWKEYELRGGKSRAALQMAQEARLTVMLKELLSTKEGRKLYMNWRTDMKKKRALHNFKIAKVRRKK